MTNTQNAAASTKVITGKVRLSYEHIWEPAAVEEGGEKKYSASLLIPKSDKDTVRKLEAAIKSATEIGKSKWGGKIPAKLKLPLRDGDLERPEDDAYASCWFLNATSRTKPGVVDKNVQAILSRDEVYSGCFIRASINFYPFDTKGNKGVAVGLNNIQKLEDGEPLAGRTRAEDDFADNLSAVSGTAADGDDLL